MTIKNFDLVKLKKLAFLFGLLFVFAQTFSVQTDAQTRRKTTARTVKKKVAAKRQQPAGDNEKGLSSLVKVTQIDEIALKNLLRRDGANNKPLLVNFWATWCEPCRRELPDLQALADRRDDVRVVGVDIGEDAGPALAFLDELGVSFDQYADPRGELTAALEVVGLPATFVTDGSGRITWEHLGELDIPDLEAVVSEF